MTCIAAVVWGNKVTMGGDSAVTGYVEQTLAAKKVFRHGSFLLGYSGSVRMCNLLAYVFAPPELPADMPIERYLTTLFADALRTALKDAGNAYKEKEQEQSAGYFLLGYRDRLFRIGSDYSFVEVCEGYDAIGSGCEVALGALHATHSLELAPRKRIELALEAAADFCTGVGGPFTIEETT